MTDQALESPGDERAASRPLGLGPAAFVSVVFMLLLAAFAFWPRPTWLPPKRPALHAPIVFDEFVNAKTVP